MSEVSAVIVMDFAQRAHSTSVGAEAARIAWRKGRMTHVSLLSSIVLIAALAVVPLLSSSSFTIGRYSTAIIFVIAALGLNLALGYAGQLVLGHAVIMAAAAYSAAIISVHANWSFAPSLLGGVAAGTFFGAVMMLPGIRVSGWYLALITLFSALVLPHVAQLFPAWSGGEFGISDIASPQVFGHSLGRNGMYLTVVAAFAAVWFALGNLVNSCWGLRFKALRDAPRAAEAVGIDLVATRFYAYVVCAIPPALAGSLLAFSERFVHYESFPISLSLLLLTGVVLGGAGTRWGPVVGMAPLLALSFWVGPFSPYNAVGLGLGLLVAALLFTNGLAPFLAEFVPDERADHGREPELAPAPPIGSKAASDIRIKEAQGALVDVRGLRKSFGGQHVLKGLDLEVRRGRLLGIVGPNGSGKSTLLNTLSGFVKRDAGAIRLAGEDIAGWPIHKRARLGLGRTFQVPQLIDELGPIENIEVGLVAHEPAAICRPFLPFPSIARANARRRGVAIETFIELGLPPEILAFGAAKIPLGLKRIVEVGRAIVSRPHVLLLDEPTAGLDDAERAEFGKLIRHLQADGMTIIIVEHNVPFVLEYCDEVVLLEDGAITAHANLPERIPDRLRAYLNYAPKPRSSLKPRQGAGGDH